MYLVYNELMGLSLTVNERPRAFPATVCIGMGFFVCLNAALDYLAHVGTLFLMSEHDE